MRRNSSVADGAGHRENELGGPGGDDSRRPGQLALRFRGSNPIDASINLVLMRSALLRASRRTATSETEPAAILRDGASRLLRMRSVGVNSHDARGIQEVR